jgi:ABC-2 type transport system permease protein
MTNPLLRSIWFVFRREYIQRVRTRSFLLSTVLTPLVFALMIGLPFLLAGAGMRGYAAPARQPVRVVLACSDRQLAEAIRDALLRSRGDAASAEVDPRVSPAERAAVDARLKESKIDGYAWLDAAAIQSGRVTYARRENTSDRPARWVQDAISSAIAARRLETSGVAPADARRILAPIDLHLESVRALAAPTLSAEVGATAMVLLLLFVMFISLLSYGIMVMRSVLDEKASRITEVLLCAATADELMAGKILGVGGAGLTQMAAWAAIVVAMVAPSASARAAIAMMNISLATVAWFPIFYLMGYLLYSAMFAAVGASFNSADEAQQWNFILVLPLIASSMLMSPVVFNPNSALAVVSSLIPFCAPVLMYARIAVDHPPLWQVALGLGLLGATSWATIAICARIYRVGILMYGTRPSARELLRWLRYA